MKGLMLAVSSTRCFSNIILFTNFVIAYSFTANNFIKFTFIKYQHLFNDNKQKMQHKMLHIILSTTSPCAQDTKTNHFQVKFNGF